jgi:hypothetical protein
LVQVLNGDDCSIHLPFISYYSLITNHLFFTKLPTPLYIMAATGSEHMEVNAKGMQAYRAPSLLQPHKARQALQDAYEGRIGPLIGFYLALPTVPTARVAAQLGADFVWVDWEHSSCGVETMTNVSKSFGVEQ